MSVQRRLVYHLWATVAQQMLASLNACVASLNTCTESTGSVDCTVLLLNDSLSFAGYSQLALDCYFVVALMTAYVTVVGKRCEAVSPTGDRARRLDIVWMQDIYLRSADVGKRDTKRVSVYKLLC